MRESVNPFSSKSLYQHEFLLTICNIYIIKRENLMRIDKNNDQQKKKALIVSNFLNYPVILFGDHLNSLGILLPKRYHLNSHTIIGFLTTLNFTKNIHF